MFPVNVTAVVSAKRESVDVRRLDLWCVFLSSLGFCSSSMVCMGGCRVLADLRSSATPTPLECGVL